MGYLDNEITALKKGMTVGIRWYRSRLNKMEKKIESTEANNTDKKLNTSGVSGSLSWIEKDRLAGIKLNEMRANAVETSILFEVSSKILRQLIIEGIDIGLNYR